MNTPAMFCFAKNGVVTRRNFMDVNTCSLSLAESVSDFGNS